MSHPVHLILSAGTRIVPRNELRMRPDEQREALLTIKRGEQPRPEVNAWRLRLHNNSMRRLLQQNCRSARITHGPMSFC